MENEIKVIKRYHYREARVKPKYILPRELCRPIEDECVKQSGNIRDNHVVFLVEVIPIAHTSKNIAFYFHDFVCIIGDEEDIVEKSD